MNKGQGHKSRATRPVAERGVRRVRRSRRSDRIPAFVLIPLEEYEKLAKSGMLRGALARLSDRDEPVIDGDEFALELAADRIAAARKAAGLTQAQLAESMGLPQSQISRIERNPDRTSIRTLKKIAAALRIDVSALVG